ncbi:LysM-like peptidoglycan-binding domain-containing protein [Gallibacterium melopsittaci]|uniref:LysM-like peptidoglycan-binding domain-containing protein n=1 Tax=Gallibacterium melopsittaci TaxID=516063 RepID=A0ABV6HYE6_9PAST
MSNIDKEQQPEQQDNNKQNELNLDFDEFEPITPKRATKPQESTSSLFDKVKGLFAKKALKQEEATPSFEATNENDQYTEFDVEPVTANKANTIKSLPTRYRRLAITLAVLIIIICLFIWLKPNSQPVDNLQSQDNNLPIEFQPIDPNAAAEANTPPQPNMDNATATNDATANPNDAATTANALTQDANVTAQQAPAVDNTPITTDAPTTANAAEDSSSVPAAAAPTAPAATPAEKTAQPALTQEQINKIEKKAYEAEQARLIAQAKARAEQRAREEFKAKQQQESRKAQALLNGKDVPVVEAKPVPRTTTKATTSTSAATSSTSGTTKYLTVPAGTSLMQVFRDNKLNIADVNAMTKANGAGNALSSFKPGDKVAVKVNNAGRVSELQLPSGAKFIRQDNGSYIYKK